MVLTGEHVVLRAVGREDVEVLAGWELEPGTWRLASDRAWVPRTPAQLLSEYDAGTRWHAGETEVTFAVEAGGGLAGRVSLWGIDLHNRSAHVGITMGPHARGRGWGTDALRVVLGYAFLDRGLHRVQLESLATNEQALAAYRRAGFVQEGVLRESAWVEGARADEVVMSVLGREWRRSPG